MRQSSWCFLFGIIGPLLLAVPLTQAKLYAEVGLQFIYVALAIFGLMHISDHWVLQDFTEGSHFILLIIGAIATLIMGLVLRKKTTASLPFVDSATTVFSIIATVLMMIPVHEAWLYFMCINFVSVIMYASRKLFFGAIMFFIYLLLSIDAYFLFEIFS